MYVECLFSCSQAKKPSLSSANASIYMQAPVQLEKATRPNLEKKVSDFVEEGGQIVVTSTSLPFSLQLNVHFV